MKFFRMFRRSRHEDSARKLYISLVEQSRRSAFYMDCGVPDTVEGRFDMIALHAFLIMRRLKQGHGAASELSQELFDVMFSDMDTNLRESGVGDLAIGRRVKKLAKAFYGRIGAYEAGLDAAEGGGVLAAALERNLFRSTDPAKRAVTEMAQYIRREASSLDGQGLESLMAGKVSFGAAPEPERCGSNI